jgi:glycosyltransferase involved in cell wall biosynthesis
MEMGILVLDHKNISSVGIITPAVSETSYLFLIDFVQVLSPIFDYVYVIAGNVNPDDYNRKTKVYSLRHQTSKNLIFRALNYAYLQAWIAHKLILLRNVEVLIFYLGGEALIFPMIAAKLLNKKVVLVLGGSSKKESQVLNEPLHHQLNLLIKMNFNLADKIIIYSQNIISEWDLEKYESKILVAPRHFIDFSQFHVESPLIKRNLIGFIGRFSIEKGVLNFVQSIPNVLTRKKEVGFFLGGDGVLRDSVLKYLDKSNIGENIEYVGWISRNEISNYLNRLRLIVLPSYTEGLPNIMLEAMACGTPVLATPVGAISSIIKDEETGFILENNSPECIAKNIIRALEHPNLGNIVENARKLVEANFTYEAAIKRYSSMFENINKR